MNASLFIDQIKAVFAPFVSKISEVDPTQEQPLFKTLLTEEESITGDFNETRVSGNIVASDIVALGSPLPLAERPSMGLVSGKIPKVGKKTGLDERQMKTIQYLLATGRDKAEVLKNILNDTVRLVKGQDLRLEQMLYQALSTGIMQTGEDETEGTAVRISFKRTENEVQSTKGWDKTDATPITDLYALFDKIEGERKSVGVLYMSKKALNQIRASKEGKGLVRDFLGLAGNTTLPSPSRKNMIGALEDEFAISVKVIDGKFKVSNSQGTTQTINGFSDEFVVAAPSGKLGRLVYTRLPEEDFPVTGVTYAKSGSYNLVSKFGSTDPVEEFTAIQAMVIPVLDNTDAIFRLKITD